MAAAPEHGAPDTSLTLVERGRELRLPIWRWEGGDVIVEEPSGWADVESWLRAPLLREWLRKARATWGRCDTPAPVEIMPGCWLLPVVEDREDARRIHAAAMALLPQALEAVEFEAVCHSAGLESNATRTVLSGLARHRREDIDQWCAILNWMHGDLNNLATDLRTITCFSSELMDTYEQISLLYRVAESMNDPGDPHAFVSMACQMLYRTLEFNWIAVRFTSLSALGPALANELIIAGEIPGSHTTYDRLAGELANVSAADQRPVVLDPQTSRLAAFVDSEVFANPLNCDHRVAGTLLAGNRKGSTSEIGSEEMQLLSATADFLSVFLHNTSLYNEQRTTLLGIVKALSASIDAKDRYTRGHSERVSILAADLALAIGMNSAQADRVRLAGLLHDVGKIGVPEAVLLKSGRLTPEEFDAIKQHPTIGYNILKEIEPLQDVIPGVLHHHERWDGEGYPHGIRASDIPLIARLVTISDTFDAMSSNRSYRKALPRSKVIAEIRDNAGTQFDPQLADRFIALDFGEYDQIFERHLELERHAA